jgi:hypothetical protein
LTTGFGGDGYGGVGYADLIMVFVAAVMAVELVTLNFDNGFWWRQLWQHWLH